MKSTIHPFGLSVVSLLAVMATLAIPEIASAQLDPRPELKTEDDTDKKKKQVIDAINQRKPLTTDQIRAGLRRQNLDYEIQQVGTPNAANDLSFGMDLQIALRVKVNGAAVEDPIAFYAGFAASGADEAIATSERYEGKGPGPHIILLRVPIEAPQVRNNRLDGDLILMSEKKMPGLPGREIVLKQFLADTDADNHRQAFSRRIVRPEISLVNVTRLDDIDTVEVGDTVRLAITASIINSGPARQGVSFVIGDPGRDRIDSSGPKVFRQGDGEFPQATMQFRVKPEQIVDGQFRTTLLLMLRDSEPSQPFSERLFVDDTPRDNQVSLAYALTDTPSLRRSNPLALVIVHGKTGSARDNKLSEQHIDQPDHFYYYWSYPFIRHLGGNQNLYPWGSREPIHWAMNSRHSSTPVPDVISVGTYSSEEVPKLSIMPTYRDGSLSLRDQGRHALNQIYDRYKEAFDRFQTEPDIVLIGHSMGGLVSRYILSAPPSEMNAELRERAKFIRDRTRFIVTIATPHDGSEAVDGAFDMDAGMDRMMELYEELSQTNPASPAGTAALDVAFSKVRYLIDSELPATADLTTERLGELNRTLMRAEKAIRGNGTYIPVYVMGGRQPDDGFYTYKPGLKTHTDWKSLPGTIKLLDHLASGDDEKSRAGKEAAGLMAIDFLMHRNDVSSITHGHHPLWGANLGAKLDWGTVPEGYRSSPPVADLDIVQRTFKTTKPKSIQLKRPLPFEGLFWSKPMARPDEWPVYYWLGEEDGEIDSDGMVSIASSLGMRLGRGSVRSESDAWYFDHTRMYEIGGEEVRGSWFRLKRGYWDLDNHGNIHRNEHTGRWIWLHLLEKDVGPYTSAGERSSWRRPEE